MKNKDNNIIEEKNSAITPESVNEALKFLPHNFVIQTQRILDNWKDKGIIEKTYTKRYISKVKLGEDGAFNEDILTALVQVGMKNKETKKKFGRVTKKTSHSN